MQHTPPATTMRAQRLPAMLLAGLLSIALPPGVLAEEGDIKDLLGRIESAEDELAVYDRLKVLSPGRADPGNRRALTDDLIGLRQALMRHPDAGDDLLDDNALTLRTIIGWRNDGSEKIELLTALLEQEIERERFESARRTQERILERLADQSHENAELFSSILPLSARIGRDALDRARDLALRVDEGEPRLDALRLLAKSALGEDRLGTAFKTLASDDERPLLVKREAMLFDFIELGAFEPAFFLALLVEVDADRDRLLIKIIDHQIEQNQPPETFIAQYAIIDDDLRDGALLTLIDDALERERPALARGFAERLVLDDALIAGWIKISAHLASEGYLAQADALLAALPNRLSDRPAVLAERVRIDLQRDQLGDSDALDQAVRRWSDHRQEPAMAALSEALAGALAKAGRINDLNRLLDETENPTLRQALFAALAMAHVRDERPSDGLVALNEIGDPQNRAEAALTLLDFLGTGETADQRFLGDLIALVESALPEVADDREAYARLALALAKRLAVSGDLDDVEKAMASLSPDQKDSDTAQHALAVAEIRDGRLLDAVRRLDRLPDSDARARMIVDVALVLAEERRFPEAATLVDSIKNWSLRAEGYRGIAERQAGRRDVDVPRKAEASRSGEANAWKLRADIPAIRPGRLHVTYLHYARYGENFASEVGEIERLREAQNTRHPRYIYLEDGVFDLPAIAAAVERQEAGNALELDGRLYTLRLPLLVGPDATLVVSGSDVDALRLAQENVAYLINAGRFYLADSQLLGWSETDQLIAEEGDATGTVFRPFFLAWSNAETTIAGAHLAGLGDGSDGFSFTAGPSLLTRRAGAAVKPPSGIVVDSLFEQMREGIHAHETSQLILAGNVIQDRAGIPPTLLTLDAEQIDAEPIGERAEPEPDGPRTR